MGALERGCSHGGWTQSLAAGRRLSNAFLESIRQHEGRFTGAIAPALVYGNQLVT
jgi:hypothetical protein